VPGLTWQACAACALDVNAVPVLVEIDPHTLCIDPAAVRRAITPRTRAIVVVHLYGAVADMDALLVISQETGIPIVEDCSHQHGAQWGDRKVGSLGAVGAFSFHQNKLLTSGEGGFVCTSDARLAHRLDALRNCGRDYFNPQKLPADYFPQSGNFRGTELQAAMLNCALPRLDAQNGQREASAARLGNLLSGIPGIMPQKRSPAVTRQSYYSFAFHYDAGQFAGLPRDLFMAALRAEISYPHIAPPYEPLTSSPLYKPLTKRRHRLSDEYWTAIDPARFDLPLCERAHAEWVTMLHYFLLAPSIQMQAVGDAIEKIRLQADRLARLKQRPPLGAA
jgi:L-glutamine:2-deoxy-scyllo-inosose/3-amino-2,3-dideoxy-scyllo-inosose aminotransferase